MHDSVTIILGLVLGVCFWRVRTPKVFMFTGTGLVLIAVLLVLKFDAVAGPVELGVLLVAGLLVVCGFGFVRAMLTRSVSLGALAGMEVTNDAGGVSSDHDLEERIENEITGRLSDLKQHHLVDDVEGRLELSRFGRLVVSMVSMLTRFTGG